MGCWFSLQVLSRELLVLHHSVWFATHALKRQGRHVVMPWIPCRRCLNPQQNRAARSLRRQLDPQQPVVMDHQEGITHEKRGSYCMLEERLWSKRDWIPCTYHKHSLTIPDGERGLMQAGRRRGGWWQRSGDRLGARAHTYAQACAHAYTLGSGSSVGCVKPGFYPRLPVREIQEKKDSYCSRPLVNALQLHLSLITSRHHPA